MPDRPDINRQRESVLFLVLFTLFLFASPLTLWWASEDNPWFLPYLLWLLVILIGAWLCGRFKHHDQ